MQVDLFGKLEDIQKMSKEVVNIAENDPFLIGKSANLQKMIKSSR